jgi:hypothetical protein
MRENFPTPRYHDKLHKDKYGTKNVNGADGEASFLATMVENIIYPNVDSPVRLNRLSHDGAICEAHFTYKFTPRDVISAPWLREQTVVSLSHVQYLGSSALKETFDIKVEQEFHIRNEAAPTVIVNDFIIDRVAANNQSVYDGAVRHFSFNQEENRVFLPMTEYDADILYGILSEVTVDAYQNATLTSPILSVD